MGLLLVTEELHYPSSGPITSPVLPSPIPVFPRLKDILILRFRSQLESTPANQSILDFIRKPTIRIRGGVCRTPID